MPLIVFEGIDGCGKSTQVKLLARRLTDTGKPFRQLREPGGTKLGEAMRATLLAPSTRACPTAELFGYLQARAQLCAEVIAPALAAKEIIILDRFYHSTIAYQGFGLGLDLPSVRAAIKLSVNGALPDLVFWLNLDPAVAQRRRSMDGRPEDRIESRGLDYMQKVHEGFKQLVKAGEMLELDGRLPESELAAAVWKRVESLI